MRVRRERDRIVSFRLYAVLAGVGIALLPAGPAAAKPVRPAHHAAAAPRAHADRHYAQSHYNYRSQNLVREEFIDAPRGRSFDRHACCERREVVEHLRGDFTGGVGIGADGFVDGYGQMHYFVGSFRPMSPLPHGPYAPRRSAPGRRGF